LLDRSQRLINLRHPGYRAFIDSFGRQDTLHHLRRQLDEARLLATDASFVLLVTLALAGGVDRFVAERCRELRSQGLVPLVLRPAEPGDTGRCMLWTDLIELPNLRYETPAEVATVAALLARLTLVSIELQHFLHLHPHLIEAVRSLPTPYDIVVHDYAWICPRITLIDGSGRYCGEPAVAACQRCVKRHGSHLEESIGVPALRARSARWLRNARQVIAPSSDAAQRLQRHFPGLEVEVKPHSAPGRQTPPSPPGPPVAAEQRPLRVALVGAIGRHKGYRVLLACARDARARRLSIEFIVVGYTENDAPLLRTGKCFVTGRYSEGEAQHLLRRERPDVAWFPSVWPETWCYTLDEALIAGLPVAAFDLGAVAERIRPVEARLLLPLGLEPRRINDALLEWNASRRHVADAEPCFVQSGLPGAGEQITIEPVDNSEAIMSNSPPASKPAQEGQEDALSASVQVLPLPAGLYLFSVRAASPSTVKIAGQLSLPAVHVGLGPGVRSDQVEFLSGPATHGAWLFSEADLLVTRVNGSGATLIMSSLRAPGGDVLSIKVERLDGREDKDKAVETKPEVTTAAPAQARPAALNALASIAPADPDAVSIQIGAHVRTRGDMNFIDAPWAGRVAPGLWIESFSVRPLRKFAPQDIEYKALTGTGFETPWLSEDKMCGTKGMSVPLVGFAVRLKPGGAAAGYDCEYSGYFQSGLTVGPLRNGAPCRSSVANDPLEGIQVSLVKRPAATMPTAVKDLPADPVEVGKTSDRSRRSTSRRP